MTPNRKSALVAGILFIVGTAAPTVGMAVRGSLLSGPDMLANIAANAWRIRFGAFMQTVMGFACAGIACALYPVLKKRSEGVAVGALVFRFIEGILAAAAACLAFELVPLGLEFASSGAADRAWLSLFATRLLSVRDGLSLVSLFAWCASAWMYYSVFFATRLVPRWISAWGLAGILLTTVANFLVFFGAIGNFSPTQVVMNLPIAVQEMAFAVYLIGWGSFSEPAKK